MPRNRLWIVDGHNVIFAIHGLREMQVGGRGEEARAELAGRLEVFAVQRQERVLVVFDGNELATGEVVARGPHFELVFARGGDGAADRHIVREASRCAAEGRPVTVVTNDIRTLAQRLPAGVARLGAQRFWIENIEPGDDPGDKSVRSDLSDFAREMLDREAAGLAMSPPSRPQAPTGPRAAPSTARDEATERLRIKREKGRLRHLRQLKRRGAR